MLRGRHLDHAVGQGNGAGPIDGSVPWLNVSIRHCVDLLAALEVQQMGEFLLLIHRQQLSHDYIEVVLRREIVIIFVSHPILILSRALLTGLLGSDLGFTEAALLAGLEGLEIEAVGGSRLRS